MNHNSTALTSYHILAFTLCTLGAIFGGMHTNILPCLLPQAVASFSSDASSLGECNAIMMSVFLIGWVIGGIGSGLVSDRHGRIKALTLCLTIYGLALGSGAFSFSYLQLTSAIFIAGMGIGGTLSTLTVLVAETMPGPWRMQATATMIAFWQFGLLCSGLVTYHFPNWRDGLLTAGFPLALALLVYCLLKEPDTWKFSKKKERASLLALFHPDVRAATFVGGTSAAAMLLGYWPSIVYLPLWTQKLMATPFDAISWTLMAHGAGAFLGCVSAGLIAHRFSRPLLISLGLFLSWGISLWIFWGTTVFTPLIYLQFGLFGYAIGFTQGTMYIFLPEIFPVYIRGTAVGFCLNAGRLLTIGAIQSSSLLVVYLGSYGQLLTAFSYLFLVGSLVLVWATYVRPQTIQPIID